SLSFYVLSRTFMAHKEVDWQDIGCDFVIDGARIGLAGLRMRDRDLARRWRHYHHTLAAIRLVRAEVNQSLSSASRVRAGDRQLNLAPYLVEPEPPEEPDDDERECGCTCDSPAQWSSPTRGRAEGAASHPWISSFRRSAIRPTGATPATSRPTR